MKNILFVGLTALAVSQVSAAKISKAEAAKLGQDLTPIGAQIEANSDGSIPKWDPSLKPELTGEKPSLILSKANYKQHLDNLTSGQIKMFETYADFTMPIYTSYRTATVPKVVADNTKKYASTAELINDGVSFKGAYNAIPFPIPNNGLEAIWNHMTRYRGIYESGEFTNIISHTNGSIQESTNHVSTLYNYSRVDQGEEKLDNILLYYITKNIAPAQTAGQSTLVHETLDQTASARNVWAYNPGRRRVRRAPSMAYDTPIGTADGLRTADDTDMYNGAPDRFTWELKGKREIYIPYNNVKLAQGDGDVKEVAGKHSLNSDFTRFEKHRVWVVEATLKEDARHIYSKRTFYLDEDSWNIVVADQYDNQGELWRVSMSYLYTNEDNGAALSAGNVFHDLQARRYFAFKLSYGSYKNLTFSENAPSKNTFTSNALRQRGAK